MIMLVHRQVEISHIFPAKDRSHGSHIDKIKSLTFDDLHHMTLIGHHVTQYMYVLFDNVHIYIQKPQITLAPYVQ